MAEKNFKVASGIDASGTITTTGGVTVGQSEAVMFGDNTKLLNILNNKLAFNSSWLATESYVDGVAQGLDIKESVRFASTGDLVISDLYDGNVKSNAGSGTYAFAQGDRILLKNQSNKNENGIWEVGLTSGSATRTQDADSFAKLNKGSFVFVEQGDNAGKGYVVTYTDESGALGAVGTENSWSQFSEAGSYITNSSAPFNVVNGTLTLSTTNSLYVDGLTNQLDVNTNIIATQSYVDTAVGNISVNVNALAGTGIISDGSALSVDASTGTYGHMFFDGNLLDVNVNALIGPNTGLRWTTTSEGRSVISVNVNAIATDLAGYEPYTKLYVESGQVLVVNTNNIAEGMAGTGLYVVNGDDLAVNTNAIAGTGLFSQSGTLAVNVNALSTEDYGAKSFFVQNDGVKSNLFVNTATTSTSNTYVSVGSLDTAIYGVAAPQMFDVEIIAKVGSKVRTSRLSGINLGGMDGTEYTEYAIVESGGSITGFDVIVDQFGAVIKAKATLDSGEDLIVTARGSSLALVA